MPTAPETWDRRPGEPERAYEAFRVFLGLGPERSLSEAYRQKTGRPTAEKPDTTWNRWTKAYEWTARALDYDRHISAVATRAADRAVEQVTSKWIGRSDAQADADFAFSQKYAAEVAGHVNRVALGRKDDDGKPLGPLNLKELKDAIAVTSAASALAWSAISSQLPDTHVDLDPYTATAEQLTEAIERLQAAIGPAHVRPRIARTG